MRTKLFILSFNIPCRPYDWDGQAWSNSVDPDQTPQNAASDLGLHCLPLSPGSFDILACGKIWYHNNGSLTARLFITLRTHAYSNIMKILQPKKENVQIKNSDIFQISAQNIDCGYSLEPIRRGDSNEYPQSMFF